MAAVKLKRLNLVAVDSSEHSDRAFEWYINHYHREGDQVGIVHVHTLPNLPSLGLYAGGAVLSEGYQLMVNESIEASKTVGQKYKEICESHKIPHILYIHTAQNSVGETICKIANESKATTLIMGTRGLGQVRRTFLGSVSDYVIHHSHVPTVIVPTPK